MKSMTCSWKFRFVFLFNFISAPFSPWPDISQSTNLGYPFRKSITVSLVKFGSQNLTRAFSRKKRTVCPKISPECLRAIDPVRAAFISAPITRKGRIVLNRRLNCRTVLIVRWKFKIQIRLFGNLKAMRNRIRDGKETDSFLTLFRMTWGLETFKLYKFFKKILVKMHSLWL